MKESLSSWNQIYEMLFAIQQLLKLSKNSKNRESQILELLKNKLQFEVIENFHCVFEDVGIKYLDLIRQKDVSFFDNPNCKAEFLLFYQCNMSEPKKCNLISDKSCQKMVKMILQYKTHLAH